MSLVPKSSDQQGRTHKYVLDPFCHEVSPILWSFPNFIFVIQKDSCVRTPLALASEPTVFTDCVRPPLLCLLSSTTAQHHRPCQRLQHCPSDPRSRYTASRISFSSYLSSSSCSSIPFRPSTASSVRGRGALNERE
jgi:hypothetical protein